MKRSHHHLILSSARQSGTSYCLHSLRALSRRESKAPFASCLDGFQQTSLHFQNDSPSYSSLPRQKRFYSSDDSSIKTPPRTFTPISFTKPSEETVQDDEAKRRRERAALLEGDISFGAKNHGAENTVGGEASGSVTRNDSLGEEIPIEEESIDFDNYDTSQVDQDLTMEERSSFIPLQSRAEAHHFMSLDEISNRIANIKLVAKEAFSMGELDSTLETYNQAIYWLTEEIQVRNENILSKLGVVKGKQESWSRSRAPPQTYSLPDGDPLPTRDQEEKQPDDSEQMVLSKLLKELGIFYANRALIHMKLSNLSPALYDSLNSGKLGFWKGDYRAAVVLQNMGKYQEALDHLKLVKQIFPNLREEEVAEVRALEHLLEKETTLDQILSSGDENEIMKKFESVANDTRLGVRVPEKLLAQFVYFFSKRKNIPYIRRIFQFIREYNVDADVRVYVSILQCYISGLRTEKTKSLEDIKEVLKHMEEIHIPLNDVGHTLLLRYVVPVCDAEDVEGWDILTTDGILRSMEQTGFRTLSFVDVLAFLDCEKTIRSSVMKSVFGKLSVPPDARLFTSLVIQTKQLDTALDIHNFMLRDYGVDYTIPFYNALLNRMSKAKDRRTLAIYRAMRRNNLLPDPFTYRILLREARLYNNITLYENIMNELEKRNITINDIKLTFHQKASNDQITRSERRQFVKAKQTYSVDQSEEKTSIEKKITGYEDISRKKRKSNQVTTTGTFGYRF